jgi:ISXO2-like transposase domain
MLCNCKNGVSSCEVARSIGVTQKSAWFMLHRIRLAMKSGWGQKLSGEVEADETYIGGKLKNMHAKRRALYGRQRGAVGKTAVAGILQRGGKVRATVIPHAKQRLLQANVRANVELGSELMTDEALAYYGLNGEYVHQVVNHLERYVDGKIHTNGLENFWSLLKRGLNGTYISVEPFHLDRYVDEQVFRYNNRKNMNDQARFEEAMHNVAGKRLTYNELIGLGSATSH